MIHLPDIKKANLKGKTVFLRADLDVPLAEFKVQSSTPIKSGSKFKVDVEDDTRLVAGLPTVEYLLEKGAKVIIGGHLGRPEKKFKVQSSTPIKSGSKFKVANEDREFSLEPVARWYVKKFKIQNSKFKINLKGLEGWKLTENLILLENLRFYEGEEENDLEFAKKLASLADIYVNDAFAMSHRSHASVVGICNLLPHFAGIHLQKEASELSIVLENPKRPLVVVIGGKKVETKLPLVEKMHQIADYVLVGGKIAQEGGVFIKISHEKISGRKSVLQVANTNEDGSDITEKDAENFSQIINLAKTVVWNGPMGVLVAGPAARQPQNLPTALTSAGPHSGAPRLASPAQLDTERGTRIVAQGIVDSGAYSVVGGGDTTEFLKRINLYNKFNFVSTGGGAMLSFLSGEKLPGLEALREKNF